MSARCLEVEYVNKWCVRVRGYGSRELIVDITGRAPVHSREGQGGWVVQEKTLTELLARCDHLGWSVVMTGPRTAAEESRINVGAPDVEPERSLW